MEIRLILVLEEIHFLSESLESMLSKPSTAHGLIHKPCERGFQSIRRSHLAKQANILPILSFPINRFFLSEIILKRILMFTAVCYGRFIIITDRRHQISAH